jgi:hypothetical protein
MLNYYYYIFAVICISIFLLKLRQPDPPSSRRFQVLTVGILVLNLYQPPVFFGSSLLDSLEFKVMVLAFILYLWASLQITRQKLVRALCVLLGLGLFLGVLGIYLQPTTSSSVSVLFSAVFFLGYLVLHGYQKQKQWLDWF